MKKLFTLLSVISLTVCSSVQLSAQSFNYLVNENFDGMQSLPSSLTLRSNPSGASVGYIGRSASYSVANNVITFTGGAGGGNRGAELEFASTENRKIIYVEYDWAIAGAQVAHKNSIGTYLLGSNSSIDTEYTDMILAIYAVGETTTTLHIQNLDNTIEIWKQGGSLIKCGESKSESEEANLSTKTEILYSAGKSYHISATLDFENKKVVSLSITDNTNSTNSSTFSNLPFISPTVSDLSRIGFNQSRGGQCGNGLTVNNLNTSFDNIQVYEQAGIPSSITNPESEKTVKSVEFFNVAGAKSEPTQKGLLIKVTKYTDGSSSITKEFKK